MKRSNPNTKPVLSWTLTVRNCEMKLPGVFENCLKFLRKRTPDAEICIVDTLSDDVGTDLWLGEHIPEDQIHEQLEKGGHRVIFIENLDDKQKPSAMAANAPVTQTPKQKPAVCVVRVATRFEDLARLDKNPLDAISVTRGPSTIEIAKKYADKFEQYCGPRGTWTKEMAAVDDMAAARNFCQGLATGRWIGWADSDDYLCDPDVAERLLKLNSRWQPGKDGTKVDASDGAPNPTLIEIIEHMEKAQPDIEAFWAPYAFKVDVEGRFHSFQSRERIVKNDGTWMWKSVGHELLVKANPDSPPAKLAYLAHLLFLHQKRWTVSDEKYSLTRHYAALAKVYDSGEDRSCRTCLYLANFSRHLCPQRTQEFIDAGYEAATLPIDRYRVLIQAAFESFNRGFLLDSYEHISAAIATRPDLPDAYFHGGTIATEAEDWVRAADLLEKCARASVGHIDSEVTPRDQTFGALSRAAFVLWRQGKMTEDIVGDYPRALACYDRALNLANEVALSPDVGPDENEAKSRRNFYLNMRDGLQHALMLTNLYKYLVRNDESQKALKILDVMPHQYAHMPLAEMLRQDGEKVVKHLTDPDAYQQFYRDDAATGAFYSDPEMLINQNLEGANRISFLSNGINRQVAERIDKTQRLKILDVGPFDGISSMPMLARVPADAIDYLGVEANSKASDHFAKMLKSHLPEHAPHCKFKVEVEQRVSYDEEFDSIIFYEVIEHVPSPVESLKRLFKALVPGGRLYISTPNGSYDKGTHSWVQLPDGRINKTRDPRGHVRAMTARDLTDAVEEAGGRVEDMHITCTAGGWGSELYCSASKKRVYRATYVAPPVSFVAPAALWNWNATKLLSTGQGASEGMIVHVARHLAYDSNRKVEVYSPAPIYDVVLEEETRDGVAYWDLPQMHNIKPHHTIVVSRNPGFGLRLEDVVGLKNAKKVLWLQDAIYPGFNDEIASHYSRTVVVSNWHKQAMHERHGIALNKMEVLYNFLNGENYTKEKRATMPKRERHHFIWPSSPDRGLVLLLEIWPQILDKWSDATLDVFYGWEGLRKLASQNPRWVGNYRAMRKKFDILKFQNGIRDMGRINGEALVREFHRADVWNYATTFSETGCASALEARAAGCVPVTHPIAALAETAACAQAQIIPALGAGESVEVYGQRMVKALEAAFDTSDVERAKMSEEAVEKFRAEVFIPKWKEILA